MSSKSSNLDDEYAAISLSLGQGDPSAYIDDLRQLAKLGHIEAMSLLAIQLGDIDSEMYRKEIISLYERAHELGSPVAAENLSIQYQQWNEPLLSKVWLRKAKEREMG